MNGVAKDRHGQPIEKGTDVLIPCSILHISPEQDDENHCFIILETVEKSWPAERKATISLLSSQVVRGSL